MFSMLPAGSHGLGGQRSEEKQQYYIIAQAKHYTDTCTPVSKYKATMPRIY